MDRKSFIKALCIGGSCSCMAVPVFTTEEEKQETTDKKMKELNQKIQFMQTRMAKLIDILDGKMDDAALAKVLKDLGTECSKEYAAFYKKYKNNLDGFLQMAEKDWKMKIDHDKEKKVVKIIGQKTGKCFCPFVKESLMSEDFCNCSLGWQTQTFASVIGKPVKARVLQSVLRGSKSCDFAIYYT
jgi:hypothetical protein